jgi:hypothetical protein
MSCDLKVEKQPSTQPVKNPAKGVQMGSVHMFFNESHCTQVSSFYSLIASLNHGSMHVTLRSRLKKKVFLKKKQGEEHQLPLHYNTDR